MSEIASKHISLTISLHSLSVSLQDVSLVQCIQVLNECSKYLDDSINVSRADVLSAWRGWRPLAKDPHAAPDAPVSRDHIISENPETGVFFIAGGSMII